MLHWDSLIAERALQRDEPGMADNILLSLVICTYNRYDFLLDALASIEQQSLAYAKFELIVVDNSADRARQEEFMRDLVIECPYTYVVERTPGLSRARNIAIARAAGDIVAFLDDDAIADRDWAQSILDGFARDPKIGILGGPVQPIWPVERPAWLHPWLEGFLTIIDRGSEPRELKPAEWLAGTNIAFRKGALVEAGGFNETVGRIGRLLLSNEELQVSDKIKAAGFVAFYEPRMVMRHRVHIERISQQWMRQRVAWQAISDIFSNPHAEPGGIAADVNYILDYLALLPPRDRGIHGLFIDIADSAVFQKQTVAVQALIRLLTQNAADWRSIFERKT
jgi:glycosyltransferase involved in cell wall biosynthesis